jgi:hypothetical protein
VSFASGVMAQRASNYRVGRLTIDTMILKLDTLSILPETFSLQGLPPEAYRFDPITATLAIADSAAIGKTVTYSYRVFTLDFSKKIARKSPAIIMPKHDGHLSLLTPIAAPQNHFSLNNSDLETTGSISRGVSIGNNQDFVLNSSLNLQITGKLSEEWNVSANITDKEVPIQPEGNSRSINDFNRIFIQLKYKNNLLVNAGDIDITRPYSQFLVVNRRVLGMEVIADNRVGAHQQLYNRAGGGMAKGKYVKKSIAAMEGVQGPYKLTGEQNELAIVIIAGSERVYMDGVLLLRGEENDYVIDYNSGELIFTNKRLISAEKRLVVEYEYNNLNYAHFTLYSFNEFNHEKRQKLKLNVNFFHEQDIKSQSLQPELDEAQKLFLSQLGNAVTEADYPNVKPEPYNGNEILYRRRDTVVAGEAYSVYCYASAPSDTLYRLGFTYKGAQLGNYVMVSSSANGRVFQWTAPRNGVPQGDYEPVMLLNTPKMLEMGTVAAEYNFLKNSGIKGEFAFSNYDENLFSKRDNGDNLGMAFKVELFHHNRLHKKGKRDSSWLFKTGLSYEYEHENFCPVESYRSVEFGRDYNLSSDYSRKRAAQMLRFNAGFVHPETGSTEYNLNWYNRVGDVQALRNELVSHTRIKGFGIHTQTSFLLSQDSVQGSRYVQSYNTISKTFRKLETGVKDNLEYNAFREAATQRLRAGSYAFNEALIYLCNSDSMPYLYHFSFKNRIDNSLFNHVLSVNNVIYEAQASFEVARLKHHKIKGTAIFRNNNVRDSARRFKAENNFVGRLEYAGNFLKNSIMVSAHYEAGSGLEQKKSYAYLKVAAGQGNFTWNDYNGNGIEELNEFEPAQFQDEANYIKVWLANNEYVNTYNNQLTLSLQLRPGNVWYNARGFRKFMSCFSNSTLLRTDQKNSLKNSANAFNPFHFNLDDTALVSSNAHVSNTFSFNSPSSYIGADYTFQQNRTKSLLFYGIESNDMVLHQFTVRGRPHKSLSLTTDLQCADKRLSSGYFSNRNYLLRSYSIDNAVQWQHENKIQAAVGYIFKDKRNRAGEEWGQQHSFTLDFSYRMAQKGAVQVQAAYINIRYRGEANSTLGYEMLEGLKAGHNITWGASFQTNITEYLRLDLSYEGRVSEGHRVIHTGNMSVRAHF